MMFKRSSLIFAFRIVFCLAKTGPYSGPYFSLLSQCQGIKLTAKSTINPKLSSPVNVGHHRWPTRSICEETSSDLIDRYTYVLSSLKGLDRLSYQCLYDQSKIKWKLAARMIGENTQSVIIQKNFSPQNGKVYTPETSCMKGIWSN